jgi:hypothetical protein
MKLLAIFITALAVTGCAKQAPVDWTPLLVTAQELRANCERWHARGVLAERHGTGHSAVERCVTEQVRSLYAAAGWPYMDLLELAQAQRLDAAEKRDRGELSETQANLRAAEIAAQYYSEINRRSNANAQTEAARSAAASARAATINAAMPTVCSTSGGIMICN